MSSKPHAFHLTSNFPTPNSYTSWKVGRGKLEGVGRVVGRPTEQQIHAAVIGHLRQRGVPGLVFIHCPNGGKRSRTEGAIFKGLGVRAGTSDLLLWYAGQSFALELKREGGRASPAQLQFLADMQRAGAYVCLAEGLDAALHQLEDWKLLHGRTM